MPEAATSAARVHVQREGRAAWVTLDRPPLNVMDIALLHELGKAVHHLTAECDVIVFRGAGPRGFSAGVEIADHAPERVGEMLSAFHGVFRQLWRADCISIATVHGHCLGGGAELATFCDFVIAGESAQFGQPEINLGCFPPLALVTYPALAGPRAALDLILTGRTVGAREAQALGLVTQVVRDGELEATAQKLIAELSQKSNFVLRMTRRAIWQRSGFDFERSLREAEELYLKELMRTHDAQEGIRAFTEKRQPVWQGR
ncbi:MAG: enoyl-CoA hydratase/isomerase family protein [Candidatus Acidiferrales bacterium]